MYSWARKQVSKTDDQTTLSCSLHTDFYVLHSFFSYFFLRERGREGEREGEKHQCEREILIGCLSDVPQLGTQPTTQACALTRNQTKDLSLRRMMSNQLIHSGQGCTSVLGYLRLLRRIFTLNLTHISNKLIIYLIWGPIENRKGLLMTISNNSHYIGLLLSHIY